MDHGNIQYEEGTVQYSTSFYKNKEPCNSREGQMTVTWWWEQQDVFLFFPPPPLFFTLLIQDFILFLTDLFNKFSLQQNVCGFSWPFLKLKMRYKSWNENDTVGCHVSCGGLAWCHGVSSGAPSFAQSLVQVALNGIQEVCGVNKVLVQLHPTQGKQTNKNNMIKTGQHIH